MLYHGRATNTRGPAPRANDAFYEQKLPALYSYPPARGKRLLAAHGWPEVGGVMQRYGQRLAFPIMLAYCPRLNPAPVANSPPPVDVSVV